MTDARHITEAEWQDIEMATDLLVKSRYPYQVENVLKNLDSDFHSTAVAAALARSLRAGIEQGRAEKAKDIRERLGL